MTIAAPRDQYGHALDLSPSDDLRNFDHLYEASAVGAVGAIPDVFHGYGGVELYQDGIGACAGFSGAGYQAAMGWPGVNDGTGFWYFNTARMIDEWAGESYDFTSINAVCKVLRAAGIITGWEWATTWDAYVRGVVRGPVIRGWDWTNGMSHPNAQGIITDALGPVIGGHATLSTGILPSFGNITTHRNWWQRKPRYLWGHDGNFYLPVALDQQKFQGRAEAAILYPVAR